MTVAAGQTASDAASTVSGVQNVRSCLRQGPSGSPAGYRVEEVLLGPSTTAVGRTSEVSGQFDLSGTTVTSASFTVQMASVVSDKSRRNQFDGRIMDVEWNIANPSVGGFVTTADHGTLEVLLHLTKT
jgi:hypothetical protein